jgi:hypothetical protein
MDSRFFIDAETPIVPLPPPPIGRALRAGLLAPLAGLVAAVAVFVTTLSVVAQSQEARAVATDAPTPMSASPTAKGRSEPLLLANAERR